MCGRYTVFTEQEIIEIREIIHELNTRFSESEVASLKTGEIFPTNLAPILCLEDSRIAPKPAIWGFPRWTGKGTIINARAETALEKGMFRKSLLERRCIIPTTGFYEWKHVEGQKKKDKYYLKLPDTNMLYMAGMTNIFKDASGNPYEAYCILTTTANQSVCQIHDRMPVILKPDEQKQWLTDNDIMRLIFNRSGPELQLIPAV